MNIRESLNAIDHKCLDSNSRFYDLRTFYESYSDKLSSDDKQKLKDLINKDTDADVINAFLKSRTDDNLKENYDFSDFDDSEFEVVEIKSVKDSDGFYNDYTWYKHPEYGNVFVFGDHDIYRPEDGNFDWETESDEEAEEWFENYTGFDDEDLYESLKRKLIDESLRLNEKNLNRLVKGHDENGYAIISGSRGNLSVEENNKRTKKLKSDIRSAGYSYVSVLGGYQEVGQETSTEKSFMVFPYSTSSNDYDDFDAFQKFIISLTKKYDQDSVLIKRPGENPRYWNRIDDEGNTSEDWAEWDFSSEPTINDVTKQYFTALKSWKKDFNKGNPQRWTFEEYHLANQPNTIMGSHSRYHSGELNYYSKLTEARNNYGNSGPWWYFSKHGFQPGSIPKDINVERIIDTPNGSYALLDGVLTTQELMDYDIKEKVPSRALLDEEQN